MIERNVEIECDSEVSELFFEIEALQERLKRKGVAWHRLSYFYFEGGASFWRFDWEYVWDRNHEDLKTLLDMAIKEGKEWL